MSLIGRAINGQTFSHSETGGEVCPSAPSAPDVDLMVTEEVVVEDINIVEEIVEEVKTTTNGTAVGRPPKKSKILVTLSDDLSYTLTIDGETLGSVMDSIAADEYMKNEWNSWQRFIQNPNQFFVYIFDNDFKEYVRYRTDIPIKHLSKIKIRNRFYVNQTGLKNGYQQLIGSQSPAIEDAFDAEPTDALIGDQNNNSSGGNQWPQLSTAPIAQTILSTKNHNKDINTDIISHNVITSFLYFRLVFDRFFPIFAQFFPIFAQF